MKIKEKSSRINKSMTFAELMRKHPEAAMILMQKGLQCVGCSMAAGETIEQGAIMHGISPEKLVDELNAKINKKLNKRKAASKKIKKKKTKGK